MDYLQQRLANGATLHFLPMGNYKTTFVGAFFYWPLGEDAAQTAIVPHILQRGTARYPTALELRSRLAELYGAQFGIGVLKRGETMVLQLKLQLVDEHYLPDSTSVLAEAVEIFRQVMLEPYTVEDRFQDSYFQGERRNIAVKIKSLLNDKSRFAFQRCLQHLCPQRGYSKNQYGSLGQVEALSAEDVWHQYKNLLLKAPVDIYVCGRYDQDAIGEKIAASLQWPRHPGAEAHEAPRPINAGEAKVVRESMELNQGKLVMALSGDIGQQSHLYPALIMYNGILGGYPHSKLFQTVREKYNLAYYIGSSLDSIMGLQFITAGIDAGSYSAATDAIASQLAAMEEGKFSQEELEWTRASLKTGLLQMYDSLGEQVALAVDARISGRRWTIPELLAALAAVSAEDVRQVARQMSLRITYFLAGGGD